MLLFWHWVTKFVNAKLACLKDTSFFFFFPLKKEEQTSSSTPFASAVKILLSFQSYRLNIQEKALWAWATVKCNWDKGLWETCWFSQVLSWLRPKRPTSNLPAVDSLLLSNSMLFDFYQDRGHYELVICLFS